jgi:hypothetical protein
MVYWNMANNIIAYAGLESFDTILYLSRILQRLDHKVLVVDNSDSLALTRSVPQISELDTKLTTISYRRVDFTRMPVLPELAEEYDDVLIGCGMKEPDTSVNLFTRVVFVTDMFEYNLLRLADISKYYNCNCEKELLIRDAIFSKISPEQISERIGIETSEDKTAILYRDEKDYTNALNSHINQVFTLNLSGIYKKYLIDKVIGLCKNVTRKEVIRAYKEARNGG